MSEEDLLTETGDDNVSPSSPDLLKPDKATPDDVRASELDTSGTDGDKEASSDLLSGDEGTESKNVVPDAYVFEPPEGVSVDQVQIDKFGDFAKEMGLTQDQYSKIVNYELNRSQEFSEAAVAEWKARTEGWAKESISDREFGGSAYEESMAVARTALKKFGDESLVQLLSDPSPENPMGLGLRRHPGVFRAFARIGKAMGNPSFVEGSNAPTEQDKLERLYPSMYKK